MKEFSSLNGYGVKDATSRENIKEIKSFNNGVDNFINEQIETNKNVDDDIKSLQSDNAITPKYPKLTDEQKTALSSLANDYYLNVRAIVDGVATYKGDFYYDYDHNLNRYADNSCFYNSLGDNGRFVINCVGFVSLLWMGRSVEDFAGKNKDTYSPVITKKFDWGYFPQYKYHSKMTGLANRDSNGEITSYYSFVKPNSDSYEESYSMNSYYKSTATTLYNQQFNQYMNANDLARELYEMGCEIPFSELDVGDLLFTKPNGKSLNSDTEFFNQKVCWRNITHVLMVVEKRENGDLVLIECAGDSRPIYRRSIAFTGGSDVLYSGVIQRNTVMCARHPVAYGLNNMSDITEMIYNQSAYERTQS